MLLMIEMLIEASQERIQISRHWFDAQVEANENFRFRLQSPTAKAKGGNKCDRRDKKVQHTMPRCRPTLLLLDHVLGGLE